jgi:hypothetical protein
VIERLVALGPADGLSQGDASGEGLQAFGEVGQRVIAEDPADAQGAGCRMDQRFDGMKGTLPKELTDEQRPEQGRRRNLRLPPTGAGSAQVSPQT